MEKTHKKFKIEKNVPIPAGNTDYPLVDLEVGDSFTVPSKDLNRIRAYMNGTFARHYPDRKFKTRDVDGKNHRIWRIV